MIRKTKKQEKRSTEDIISMILGLAIVLILGLSIFKFFERNKGKIDIPGISLKIEEVSEERQQKEAENMIKVVKGQTLWQIAEEKYGDGFKWSEIAKANKIDNPNKIEVGQELVIPQIERSETEKIPEEYTVAAGDSLWKIATRFYKDGYQWTKIWQKNQDKLRNPDQLEIGMKLAL